MLTQDESTPSLFIGGLRILIVIDFTILGLFGGIIPHVAVFSSPHAQPRKCWVILRNIFNGVKKTRPSCILHLLISVMGADNHPRVSKLRIFEGVAYEVSAPSQLQGGPTGSL